MQGSAVGPYKKSNEVLPRHVEHSPVTGAGQNVRRPCRGAVISHLMSITSPTRKILSRYTTHACRYYIAVRDRMRAIRITALAARENEDSGRWHITSSPLNKTCQRPRKYKIVGYMRDGIKFHQALLLSVTDSFIAPHLQHQTTSQPPQVHFVIFWYDKLLKLCYHLLLLYIFVLYIYVLFFVICCRRREEAKEQERRQRQKQRTERDREGRGGRDEERKSKIGSGQEGRKRGRVGSRGEKTRAAS
ncbi:hypothetical protein ALC57_06145 [Trachymyrmex cornetzi]|uniref:Uncharacterized protein n=1 Tax=Trachymyrmex cornetzi TaxID=471704 RepID=A0A195E8U2_9HYME|nr:hypothetical protein ALC57_06145 [Trachymyrmex cornetzi]